MQKIAIRFRTKSKQKHKHTLRKGFKLQIQIIYKLSYL